MKKMVTTKPHKYAGRQLGVDDEFDCEDKHVELMKARGVAKEHKGYKTRVMDADSPRGARQRKDRVVKQEQAQE